jgi:hypothetical protein
MEKQQSYSHGLLLSVAPESFSFLHLRDEDGKDTFDWEAYKSQYVDDSLVQIIINFLKTTAVRWAISGWHQRP